MPRRCHQRLIPAPNERRRAFALAAVVVCLVLVSVALVGMARLSLQMAAETRRFKRDLQMRWGARSCQATLLQVAPELFDRLEQESRDQEQPGPAPAELSYRFALGGTRLDIWLRDESASLDLNTAYHYLGRSRLETSVRRLVGPRSGQLLRLRPAVPSQGKPDVEDKGEGEDEVLPIAFQGWGEVLRTERLRSAATRMILPGLTARVTCAAGTGLNVRRASDSVIEATCEMVVSAGEAKKVSEACREVPRPHIYRILEQVGIDRRDQLLLQELLTEQSTCYSIWIGARDAQRRRLTLGVVRYYDDGTYGVSSSCF